MYARIKIMKRSIFMKRVFLIVLDSVGIGALPDAGEFGDIGSHTLGNIHKIRPLSIPNMTNMGIGLIEDARLEKTDTPIAAYGRLMTKTKAKDTTSGHWEMMGIIMDPAFKTYTASGFPHGLIKEFEEKIGRKTLVNKAYSGTEVLKDFGNEHMKTGYPIVYTSADSVFQIAAHEDIIPVEKLYEMCEIAFELAKPYHIGRIIARPFTGKEGHYVRTANRKDFSIPPIRKTVLDMLVSHGENVVGIGKIEDIFSNQGITASNHTTNNRDSTLATIELINSLSNGLVFTNLVDFDMLYGHRNDIEGYAKAIEAFDNALSIMMANLKEEDILIITADHGCDPTTKSTDHSREYVPLLIYGDKVKPKNLGTGATLANIGATICEYLECGTFDVGMSYVSEIISKK